MKGKEKRRNNNKLRIGGRRKSAEIGPGYAVFTKILNFGAQVPTACRRVRVHLNSLCLYAKFYLGRLIPMPKIVYRSTEIVMFSPLCPPPYTPITAKFRTRE